MKQCLKRITIAMFASQVALAADLMDIYKQALENDTQFKQAYDTFLSTSESVPQARAALLPQLSLSATALRNQQFVAANGASLTTNYNNNNWQVSASQALFNFQAWAQVQQAKATVKAAHATYFNAAQDLMLRTSKAYFSVQLAKDTLSFAEAKKRANKRQLEQAQQRFDVGLDAITSVYEAKAAYDQSIAEVISAKNNLINQNENLRKLTNHVYEYMAPLRDSRIPLLRPEPDNVEQWIDTGLKQNYTLSAAKFNLQASRENIKAQSAANYPNLAVQGASSRTRNDVSNGSFFVPSQQDTANIGLALSFPVFQGGLVASKTRQANYDFQKSNEQFEQSYRDVVVNSRIAFNTIVDGISKVKADRQTVISQRQSLDSTEAQFLVGTRTMVDVVNAQQRLFDAQRQLASDQYDLINATLTLKSLAGTLSVTDLAQVNSWLATTQINAAALNHKPTVKTKH